MNKTTLLCIFLLIAAQGLTQNHESTLIIATEFNRIFTIAEHPATFPGGEEQFKKYVARNINVRAAGPYLTEKQQVATVKFLVDEKGLVSHVSIVNSNAIHPVLAEQAIKILSKGPNWQPAVQNGKNVVYKVLQAVWFPSATEAKDQLSQSVNRFDKIFTKVPEPPLFPGETEGFKKYINDNFDKNKLAPALKNGPQTVKVRLIIDRDGNVSDVRSVPSPGETTDPLISEEAVRLLRKGPKWKPAKINGETVNFRAIVPVTFGAQ